MKITKYALALTALFLLSACETPPTDGSSVDGADVYGDGGDFSGIPGVSEEFIAAVGDRIFFATDSSVLSADARSALQGQASWLKGHSDIKIIVEGHCDERGTREYNLALGERRANAVRSYMINLGINSGRVSTISYGKERPAVIGHDSDAWAQNRRGVTVLSR